MLCSLENRKYLAFRLVKRFCGFNGISFCWKLASFQFLWLQFHLGLLEQRKWASMWYQAKKCAFSGVMCILSILTTDSGSLLDSLIVLLCMMWKHYFCCWMLIFVRAQIVATYICILAEWTALWNFQKSCPKPVLGRCALMHSATRKVFEQESVLSNLHI